MSPATVLLLALTATNLWLAVGLWVAHRLQPKVAHLALLVLGSAALWPLTLRVARRQQPDAASGRRGGVEFLDEHETEPRQ